MRPDIMDNTVNVLYYLYFENRELIYHFERVWTKNGMSYEDEEYSYIFCGVHVPRFPVNLETYHFLCENEIIEETGGNEHECIFMLTEHYRAILKKILKGKYKEKKTIAE